MSKYRLVLSMLLWGACLLNMNAEETVLATFNRSNYAGWTYVNDAGIELNSQNISRGRIVLYTVSQGNVRELISPDINCADINALTFNVTYRTDYGEEGYEPDKVTLKIALCDNSGTEKAYTMIQVPGGIIDHNLTAELPVPSDGGVYQAHFTAPYANLDNCGAIMEVNIISSSQNENVHGDVTGDGMVDVEDVNAIINIILKNSTVSDYPGEANVDGQGTIDVEDVNEIINIILKN